MSMCVQAVSYNKAHMRQQHDRRYFGTYKNSAAMYKTVSLYVTGKQHRNQDECQVFYDPLCSSLSACMT